MPNLANKQMCTGCTACMNVCPKQCIEMQVDKEGFRFPEINTLQCISCGRCEKVCPVMSVESDNNTNMPEAYAAFSKEAVFRSDSSSGGIFSEIAQVFLENKGAVFGAAYDSEFNVYHCCVETIEELWKLRGAKYSESDLGRCFQDIRKRLNQKQYVLAAGTPCQIAGLKAYLNKEYENLFCIDFVCHGVPSSMAWNHYVKYRAEQDNCGELPCSINLRSKDTGWSRYHYSNVFKYANGIEFSELNSNNLFMRLFVGNFILRRSCYNCRFKGYSRKSDITLGDFWGIWDIAPDMDDNRGTSVVLLQTQKSKQMWKAIQDRICCKKVSLEEASIQNMSMLKSSDDNSKRECVLDNLRKFKVIECEKVIATKKPSLIKKIVKRLFKM